MTIVPRDAQNGKLPAASVEDFFAEIFQGCGGWLEIRLIPSRRSEFFPLPGGIREAVSLAAGWSGREHVFFGVYPRSRRGGRAASAVRQVQVLYADLDADQFAGGAEEIDARLAAFSPASSAVVASGGGRHAYWLLDRVLRVAGNQQEQVKDVLWGLADALGVPRQKNTAHDLARLLRVPGTLNIKPAYGPRGMPCEVVLWEPSRRYPPSAFRELAVRGWARPGRGGSAGGVVRFTGERHDPEEVLARLAPRLFEKILTLIREGAPVGQRSEADQSVIVALRAAGATPDEIRAVFRHPGWGIGAKYREKGEDGDRYLAHSIANADRWLEAEGEGGGRKRGKVVALPTASGAKAAQESRPLIVVTNRSLDAIRAQALEALVARNDPPRIFVHGGLLARVKITERGVPVIDLLTEGALRGRLAEVADWLKIGRHGEQLVPPPLDVVRDILSLPGWPFPPLLRIVEAPTFAPDGTLIIKPGYAAGVWHHKTLDVPPIPQEPSQEDIRRAKEAIHEMICDFPFTNEASYAHAVAALLLPFARHLIDGPTPLHLYSAPSSGTGKSLLAELTGRVAAGHLVEIITEGEDEEEWRKRIASALKKGPAVVIIDNFRRRLESSALASVLTSTTWSDRILGQTTLCAFPNLCAWLATANNPALSDEIARRTVWIELDAKMDRPWTRPPQSFRHPKLRKWVQRERPRLVWSCLTLIQAWLARRRQADSQPDVSLLGGFEVWAEVMGGILHTAGIRGFLENAHLLYARADEQTAEWRRFVEAWWEAYRDQAVRVDQLYQLALEHDLLQSVLGTGNERSQRIRLGKALSRFLRDRTIGDYRCEVAEAHHQTVWRLTPVLNF